jgi:acyl-CoA synthetase (NDP forming)
MSLRPSIERLLAPQSIAVVGASDRPGAFGGRTLEAIATGGFAGALYGVHPRLERIGHIPVHRSVGDIPQRVDCVALCVPDALLEQALQDAAAAGVGGAVIFSRAYDRDLASANALPERLARIAEEAGMAVCGHNCMGFINTWSSLFMTVSRLPLDALSHGVGIVSHSGSTWSGIMGSQRNLDIGCAISAGGELVTGMADYVGFLSAQPDIRAIGLVVEAIREPEAFLAALEEADRRGVPVVALKLGRSAGGAAFTISHSGGLAGSEKIFEAVCRKRNVITVQSLDEFLDCLEMFRTPRRPGSGDVAVITDSGGERQMIADLADDTRMPLTAFSSQTLSALEAISDPGMTAGNPVDCYGDGKLLMVETGEIALADPATALLAVGTNLVHGRPFLEATVGACEQLAQASGEKPFAVFGNISTTVSRTGAERLRRQGIPVLMGTRTACRAMAGFLDWHARTGRLAAGGAEDPTNAAAIAAELQALRAAALPGGMIPPQRLDAHLRHFGFPLASAEFCDTVDAAVQAAEAIGYPLVLKTANPAIAHKTEMGGVVLHIADEALLRRAAKDIASRCGPLLQVQAQLRGGVEFILGMTRDPQFGPMITIGLGGIFTEILRDVATLPLPINLAEAEAAIASLRGSALLDSQRGRPALDRAALVALLLRFGEYCAAAKGVAEIDFNPVLVREDGAVILDMLFSMSPHDRERSDDGL